MVLHKDTAGILEKKKPDLLDKSESRNTMAHKAHLHQGKHSTCPSFKPALSINSMMIPTHWLKTTRLIKARVLQIHVTRGRTDAEGNRQFDSS